jgi:VWFA-related protein
MSRTMFHALLCCFIVASAMLMGRAPVASAADGINVTIPSVSETAFPRIVITLSAEEGGLPVAAGSGVAIHVTEDGKPLTIDSVTSASDASLPLALVLAIDTSGSMAGGGLTSVQQSVTTLISSLAPQDSAAIIGFADKVTVAQPFTTDRAALTAAVSGLKVGGNTALYDAVAQSSALATKSDASRRAIILLTDGEDYGGVSSATRDSSLESVASAGTLVYVIGVGSQVDQPYLQDVAARSGGKFFSSPDAAGVASIYASLEQLLRSQIVVTAQSNASAGSGAHTLAVQLDRGSLSGTAERTYTSPAGAAELQPKPSPALTATPVPTATPSTSHAGASIAAPFIGAGAAAVVAGLLIVFYAWRRRRPRTTHWSPSFAELDTAPVPADSAFADVAKANGSHPFVLEIAEIGARAPLGAFPVTIGSGPGCDLIVPAMPGVAPEHARVWIRDGRPMLHHLAPGYTTTVNGAPSAWASIGPADSVGIGPLNLRCTPVAPATHPEPETAHV